MSLLRRSRCQLAKSLPCQLGKHCARYAQRHNRQVIDNDENRRGEPIFQLAQNDVTNKMVPNKLERTKQNRKHNAHDRLIDRLTRQIKQHMRHWNNGRNGHE